MFYDFKSCQVVSGIFCKIRKLQGYLKIPKGALLWLVSGCAPVWGFARSHNCCAVLSGAEWLAVSLGFGD